jgi:hypothetical protein
MLYNLKVQVGFYLLFQHTVIYTFLENYNFLKYINESPPED